MVLKLVSPCLSPPGCTTGFCSEKLKWRSYFNIPWYFIPEHDQGIGAAATRQRITAVPKPYGKPTTYNISQAYSISDET